MSDQISHFVCVFPWEEAASLLASNFRPRLVKFNITIPKSCTTIVGWQLNDDGFATWLNVSSDASLSDCLKGFTERMCKGGYSPFGQPGNMMFELKGTNA